MTQQKCMIDSEALLKWLYKQIAISVDEVGKARNAAFLEVINYIESTTSPVLMDDELGKEALVYNSPSVDPRMNKGYVEITGELTQKPGLTEEEAEKLKEYLESNLFQNGNSYEVTGCTILMDDSSNINLPKGVLFVGNTIHNKKDYDSGRAFKILESNCPEIPVSSEPPKTLRDEPSTLELEILLDRYNRNNVGEFTVFEEILRLFNAMLAERVK